MAASVDVENLEHAYGDLAVVRGMSFSLAPGAIGCLLGPSGCGKTTVLRCLAGFEAIDGGSIALGGRIVSRAGFSIPPEERGARSDMVRVLAQRHCMSQIKNALGL